MIKEGDSTNFDKGFNAGKKIGFGDGVQALIDYLKNEIKTVSERSVGEPKLKAHLNAVETVVLQTVVNALEEWQASIVM